MNNVSPLVSTYEVYGTKDQDDILALLFYARNSLSQENYSIWVQIKEDWLTISADGINLRPAKIQCFSEEQFKEKVSKWFESKGISNGWIIKHKIEAPRHFSIGKGEDVLSPDEVRAIPSEITPTDSAKMAVPAPGLRFKV